MFQFVNPYIKRNPYIASGIPKIGQGFFGRQVPISLVTGKLRYDHPILSNLIVFCGHRRTGKTSLLRQLELLLPKDTFLGVYFNPENMATQPFEDFLSELADQIASIAEIELPKNLNFDSNGESFKNIFIPLLLQHLDEKCRPVLLFDEFDGLDQQTYDLLPSGSAGKCFLPFIQNIIKNEPRFAFVLATGRNYFQSHQNFEVEPYSLWVLNNENIESLIRQAEVNGTLCYSDDAVNHIIRLTNGHPFLAQALCEQIWNQAYSQLTLVEIPIVEVENVDSAISKVFQAYGEPFRWVWESFSPDERLVIECIADRFRENLFKVEQVREIIGENVFELQSLLARHIVEIADTDRYHFSLPILLRWVQQNRLLNSKLPDIQTPDEFFIAKDLFDKLCWKEAVVYFEQSLNKQPQHLNSILLMGRALTQSGNYQKAIDLLEKPYENGKEEITNDLAATYVVYAEHVLKNGSEDQALRYCQQSLDISQGKNLSAQQIKENILVERGHRDVEKHKYEAARIFYMQAGNNRLVEMIDRIMSSAYDQEPSLLIILHNNPGNYYATLRKPGRPMHYGENTSSELRYSAERWRQNLKGCGRATFRHVLPQLIQNELSNDPGKVLQINTNDPDTPWELLHDGNEFLCLKIPVAREIQESAIYAEISPKTQQFKALIIGDPNNNLPSARDEAYFIEKLLKKVNINVQVLLGQDDVTLENISLKLSNTEYDIIHFAGHGYFDFTSPASGGLRLGNVVLSVNELERSLTGHPFVFINACEGAQTKTVSLGSHGKIIDGVATALLKSGAIGCLSPLWPVDDTLAKEFALKFYEEALSNARPIGESVRLARIALKERDEAPDFWASWVLYGNCLQKLV